MTKWEKRVVYAVCLALIGMAAHRLFDGVITGDLLVMSRTTERYVNHARHPVEFLIGCAFEGFYILVGLVAMLWAWSAEDPV